MNLSLATRLGRQGRGGDTMVAHTWPLEAAILKLLGGSGTRNPRTGLLEFEVGKGSGPSGDGNGLCPMRKDARFHRARIMFGTGAGYSHILGIEPGFQARGTR